mmetsp:Transcript_14122/g.32049  ORF Transcript_14122/g.32049 Transcript_14122/m.32049 type:complete len:203 (-) Transcript_14122:1625-2233(-)
MERPAELRVAELASTLVEVVLLVEHRWLLALFRCGRVVAGAHVGPAAAVTTFLRDRVRVFGVRTLPMHVDLADGFRLVVAGLLADVRVAEAWVGLRGHILAVRQLVASRLCDRGGRALDQAEHVHKRHASQAIEQCLSLFPRETLVREGRLMALREVRRVVEEEAWNVGKSLLEPKALHLYAGGLPWCLPCRLQQSIALEDD